MLLADVSALSPGGEKELREINDFVQYLKDLHRSSELELSTSTSMNGAGEAARGRVG